MSKKMVITIVVIVLLLLVIVLGRTWWQVGSILTSPSETSSPATITITTITTTPNVVRTKIAPVKKPSSKISPLAAPLSYVEALNKYRPLGAYMQLLSCHAVQGTLSIKRRVSFMIDNQDTAAHTVAIGSVATYRLGARGFVVAAAPDKPGQYNVTCDGGGAALLNVEL